MGSSFGSAARRTALRSPAIRGFVVGVVVVVAGVLPGVALASHMFTDVPTSHTFHSNISNLANAGVTAGCGGGNYCPDQAVNRGQMAGFLNRGLGRVAASDFNYPTVGTGSSIAHTIQITPGTSAGAVAGAEQFVAAHFSGAVFFTVLDSCPCSVGVYLTVDGFSATAYQNSVTVNAGGYFPIDTAGVVGVTGSGSVDVSLHVGLVNASGTTTTAYNVYGNLSAETIPFGHAGNNVLGPVGPGGAPRQPAKGTVPTVPKK